MYFNGKPMTVFATFAQAGETTTRAYINEYNVLVVENV